MQLKEPCPLPRVTGVVAKQIAVETGVVTRAERTLRGSTSHVVYANSIKIKTFLESSDASCYDVDFDSRRVD